MCVRSNAELSSLSLIVSRTKDPQSFLICKTLKELSIIKMEEMLVTTFENIAAEATYFWWLSIWKLDGAHKRQWVSSKKSYLIVNVKMKLPWTTSSACQMSCPTITRLFDF